MTIVEAERKLVNELAKEDSYKIEHTQITEGTGWTWQQKPPTFQYSVTIHVPGDVFCGVRPTLFEAMNRALEQYRNWRDYQQWKTQQASAEEAGERLAFASRPDRFEPN